MAKVLHGMRKKVGGNAMKDTNGILTSTNSGFIILPAQSIRQLSLISFAEASKTLCSISDEMGNLGRNRAG